MAKEIVVPVNSDLSGYLNQAVEGDTVKLLAGKYYIRQRANLKPGVHLTGAGKFNTIIEAAVFEWWKGNLHLEGGDGKGQIVSGFTLLGDFNSTFIGIQVNARSNVVLRDFIVKNCTYSGVEIISTYETPLSNVTISDFEIYNSSYESGSGSFGNLQLRGDLRNIQVLNFYIEATDTTPRTKIAAGVTGGGYAIKGLANYKNEFSTNEWQKNILIKGGRTKLKPKGAWNGGGPNLGFEWWNISVEEVEITECKLDTQLSLEHAGQKPVKRSFWVHHNEFRIQFQQFIELTASYSVVEDNKIYFSNQTGWPVVFGTFNAQANLRGIVFRRNLIDGKRADGSNADIMLAYGKGQYIDLIVEDNVVQNATGTAAVFETSSAKGSKVIIRNNALPSGFRKDNYMSGVGAADVQYAFIEGKPTTPTVPVPPVTTNPIPGTGTPQIVTKTVTISRWREYKPAVIRDDDKGTITITIPYEVKTKTEEK